MTDTTLTDKADTPADSAETSQLATSQQATSQPVTSEHPSKHPSKSTTATATESASANAGDAHVHTEPIFTVDAAGGKRVALITSAMLGLMQLLVTLAVLVVQPTGAPDARAWLFVISSWLLASIVMVAVWQIAVFAQQAQLRFAEAGLEVRRPGVLGVFTRRVLLPYGQLRTLRVDLSAYPTSLETTLVSTQRSIIFDLKRLREQGLRGQGKRVVLTAPKQLLTHPLLMALKARGVSLELRKTSDAPWQPLEDMSF